MAGGSAPIEAPGGSYISVLGATSVAASVTCSAGTYCPKGSAAPTIVGAGYYAIAGSSNEIPCPPQATCLGGTFTDTGILSVVLDPLNPAHAGAIHFGATQIGGFSTMTVVLGLPSGQPSYQITGVSVAGDTTPFLLLGLAPGIIFEATDAREFAVVFTPTSIASFNAVLTISAIPFGAPDPAFDLQVSGDGFSTVDAPAAPLLLAGFALILARRRRAGNVPGRT